MAQDRPSAAGFSGWQKVRFAENRREKPLRFWFAAFLEKIGFFLKKRLTFRYVSAIIICVARATGTTEYADVAELADALDSGSSSLKRVWVQIPSSAPIKTSNSGSRFLFFIILSPYIKIQCIPQINHGMHCVFLV